MPPDTEVFRFLWQRNQQEGDALMARSANFRVRTMKLRGALSQGVLLPLAAFGFAAVQAGDDVTAQLGVEKYEPPIPLGMGEFRA